MQPTPQGPPAPPAGRAPLYVAALALVVALLATLVSVVALARTGDDAPGVAAGTSTPAPPPTTAGPTGEPTGAPTDDPSAEPTDEPTGAPDPSGVFTPAYEAEVLRIQPSSDRYIDLDEPSANARNSTGELYYSSGLPIGDLSFNDVDVAEIKTAAPTAGDCVQELRRAPIDLSVVPARGKALCVLTSAGRAASQGIRQKVVLIRMDALADDGTLNLSLTAWTVPR